MKMFSKRDVTLRVSVSAGKQCIYKTGKINYAAWETGKIMCPEGKELVPDVCKWSATKTRQLNFKAVGKTKERESQ